MFGPRISQVFRSRWHAIFWSASVLLTAYCTVPDKDQTDAAKRVVAKSQTQHHANPWAKK